MELTKESFTESVDIERYLLVEGDMFSMNADVKNNRLFIKANDAIGTVEINIEIAYVGLLAQLLVAIATDNEPEEEPEDPEDPPIEP